MRIIVAISLCLMACAANEVVEVEETVISEMEGLTIL